MSEIDLVAIGERISKRRKSMGMTQEQLAEEMDVSIQMISNLERGVKAIKIENLVKLSNILHVTTDYILIGEKASVDVNSLTERLSRLSAENRELIEVIVSYFLDKNN